MKLSHDTYAKALMSAKVVVYAMMIFWFWRIPVAAISERLVQPFGKASCNIFSQKNEMIDGDCEYFVASKVHSSGPLRLKLGNSKVLSWRAGDPVNDNVMVGIIPWLIVSTRLLESWVLKWTYSPQFYQIIVPQRLNPLLDLDSSLVLNEDWYREMHKASKESKDLEQIFIHGYEIAPRKSGQYLIAGEMEEVLLGYRE
ncbi:hypothetical protein M9H77_16598 [Catharanthus roseus]|uniref:Uncharacterized protein n=1 Tax=Catharanthus roseus TaxID=4058 RepID=A0ACC0B270_CATRO|nr:hypothetical protein M9H77_16598 [Catharanthus roseus]